MKQILFPVVLIGLLNGVLSGFVTFNYEKIKLLSDTIAIQQKTIDQLIEQGTLYQQHFVIEDSEITALEDQPDWQLQPR